MCSKPYPTHRWLRSCSCLPCRRRRAPGECKNPKCCRRAPAHASFSCCVARATRSNGCRHGRTNSGRDSTRQERWACQDLMERFLQLLFLCLPNVPRVKCLITSERTTLPREGRMARARTFSTSSASVRACKSLLRSWCACDERIHIMRWVQH